MSSNSITQVVIHAVLVFLCIQLNYICSTGASNSTVGCRKDERNALLEFKHGLTDPNNILSSWVQGEEEDCCKWEGVACNNMIGHVIRLDLRNPHVRVYSGDIGDWIYDSDPDDNLTSLGGQISSSLLGLRHLNYLDLSYNNFGGIPFPEFVGSFKRLRYLNLEEAGFHGPIPLSLANLSNLQYLSLSGNGFDVSMVDCHWLSHLSSLQHLFIDDVVIGNSTYCLQALNMLPSLVEVGLTECKLETIPSSLPHVNFTSLSTLDLSSNHINSTIPDWLFNLSGLEYLDLSYNSFHGLIPAAIGNLTSLQVLDLSVNSFLTGDIPRTLGNLCKLWRLGLDYLNNMTQDITELGEIFSGCMKNSLEELDLRGNQLSGYLPDWLGNLPNLKLLQFTNNLLSGPIPDFLGRLPSLQVLDFSNNKLNGTIPESLGFLSELTRLDLSSNLLGGDITEAHFAHLAKLKWLDLSSNSLVLKLIRPDWTPPFQLLALRMSSCKLGPQFPAWLRMQKNLSELQLSNTGISDTLPDWIWNSSSKIYSLDLSNNGITGKLPNLLNMKYLSGLDLSSNYFEGPLPIFPLSVTLLHLSNNSFSGPIHPSFGESMPNLNFLSLSTNNLNGKIPLSICKIKDLAVLDLSKNLLSGELPNCWKPSSKMRVLNFGSNNLSGGIPNSIGFLSSLESLHLSSNSLSGELPLSLKNFKRLFTLDLGHNKFTGIIPTWIGESLLTLKILRLRSNMFVGDIPPNLPRLPSLQFLDLACNNLSGTIPSSFGNFLSMKIAQDTIGNILSSGYEESILVTIRGRDVVYDRILSLVILMDLSGNSLSGEIPVELSSLHGLQSLNLSGNRLTGEITEKISELRWLERLDLSRNNLSGAIPASMSALTFLNFLNLSYNNLSGRIPSGNQLQTFIDLSIYIGNPGLCGTPLNEKCREDESTQVPVLVQGDGESEYEDGSEIAWFYISIGLGFVVGLWAVFGVLLFKRSWRYAYFRFTDKMYDCIYAAIMLNWVRIKKIM